MHDYAASLGMPEIETGVTIHVYHDLDKLADVHHELTGEPRADILKRVKERPGYAIDTDIFINALALRESSPHEQRYLAAHELNHGQRNHLTRVHRSNRPGHPRYSEADLVQRRYRHLHGMACGLRG